MRAYLKIVVLHFISVHRDHYFEVLVTEEAIVERVAVAHVHSAISVLLGNICFDEVDTLIVELDQPHFMCSGAVPDGKADPVIYIGKEIFVLIRSVLREIAGEGRIGYLFERKLVGCIGQVSEVVGKEFDFVEPFGWGEHGLCDCAVRHQEEENNHTMPLHYQQVTNFIS
jgi:hypothetical protein